MFSIKLYWKSFPVSQRLRVSPAMITRGNLEPTGCGAQAQDNGREWVGPGHIEPECTPEL